MLLICDARTTHESILQRNFDTRKLARWCVSLLLTIWYVATKQSHLCKNVIKLSWKNVCRICPTGAISVVSCCYNSPEIAPLGPSRWRNFGENWISILCKLDIFITADKIVCSNKTQHLTLLRFLKFLCGIDFSADLIFTPTNCLLWRQTLRNANSLSSRPYLIKHHLHA